MIPVSANLRLIALICGLSLLQFAVIPAALLPAHPAFGWLLALPVLATPTHWSVLHEAIHGHLLPAKRANELWGRVLSIAFGSPFQLLRFGHLMHHRFNRTALQRSDVASGPERARPGESVWYYFILTIGLYAFEVFAAALALLPTRGLRPIVRRAFGDEGPDGRSMAPLAERSLVEPPGRGRLRFDGALICALLAISFWLYGPFWWMLAAALAARGAIVSILDNVYHYGNALDDPQAGYNLRLPRPLEAAILNFNLHELHHRHPEKPWSELPPLLAAGAGAYHHAFSKALLHQFRGLIPQRIAASGARDLRNRAPGPDLGPHLNPDPGPP